MKLQSTLFGAACLALAACSGAGGGTPVPTNDAEKLKLATEIATSMNDPETINDMFDAVASGAMPDMVAMCEAAPFEEQAACRTNAAAAQEKAKASMAVYMEKAKAVMPELMTEMGTIMAGQLTGPELAKMKDFYASAEGKSIMKKMPAIMGEYQPKVMEKLQPLIMEMVQQQMSGAAPPN
jgi:hypothetical protein